MSRGVPMAVRRLLLEFGGKTPTGLPMWRMVRAGDCRILCQGRIHHFPRGVSMGFDEGNVRPDRIQGGVFWMPRYRDITASHWILQKWFPPSTWGTAEQWREHRTTEERDLRLFVQEFPQGGDYFMLAGPWGSIEAAGDLRAPIREYLRMQMENPRDLEAYIRAETAAEVQERQQRLEASEREMVRAETELALMCKSTGLDAQRVRDGMAARAGVTGHFGASEAWG